MSSLPETAKIAFISKAVQRDSAESPPLSIKNIKSALARGAGCITFFRYFRPVIGSDEHTLRMGGHIRHTRFSEKEKWEPLQESRIEQDEYDARAHHIVITHRHHRPIGFHESFASSSLEERGYLVGCIRLIRVDSENPMSPLPIETHKAIRFDDAANRAFSHLKEILSSEKGRMSVAEVSRLAIHPAYARRYREAFSDPETSYVEKRFSIIPIGLYLYMLAVAKQECIEHLLFIAEPKLHERLGKLGIMLQKIGEGIEHHGRRYPYYLDVMKTIRNIPIWAMPIWTLIQLQVWRIYRNQGKTLLRI